MLVICGSAYRRAYTRDHICLYHFMYQWQLPFQPYTLPSSNALPLIWAAFRQHVLKTAATAFCCPLYILGTVSKPYPVCQQSSLWSWQEQSQIHLIDKLATSGSVGHFIFGLLILGTRHPGSHPLNKESEQQVRIMLLAMRLACTILILLVNLFYENSKCRSNF